MAGMTEEVASAGLAHGRACYEQRRWREAFSALLGADASVPLAADDRERLAWSAALSGNDAAFLAALEALHRDCAVSGDRQRAARAAFWIGFHLLGSGEAGRAMGWLTRASRLVEHEERCAERGYLLLPQVYRHLADAENAAAERVAHEAAQIGEGCRNHDLVALAQNLEGRALLRQGKVNAGLALLDEVMLTVTAGELSPLVTGMVYCNVIATCQQIYAVDRAREWTLALTRWCEAQPELVTFTGICLVHRCEITQLGGGWRQATEELKQVCEGPLANADPEVVAEAHYQQAELARLRGQFSEAEASYRLASRLGHEAQPGIALLRLAQGQTDSALHTITRVLSTTEAVWQRARLLPAYIEITLAADELDEARRGCEELQGIALSFGTEILKAMAAHARGALYVASGDPRAAVEPLRQALGVWRDVGAPYVMARIRALLAKAFLALEDRDGAALELEAARSVFEELGAAHDVAALVADAAPPPPSHAHGLSARELQVLRQVARGKTNKQIAGELGVSERTVDRHVSNIFTKLGVATRAAATAFAYEAKLV
jgi:DNA-binding NarL/FixJ family response regulator